VGAKKGSVAKLFFAELQKKVCTSDGWLAEYLMYTEC
jgi:hypothetical protein